ncbi:DNA primase [Arthrobacter sp. VKM Ac-2550]|uniref:DNA primase n=1 Tax=Crystallibacter permensis TaxID=1938888 RepID=UPI002225EB8A|nr:DNA primase [Arthrobacter sp. VKM Ac-2550]MCW2133635.1 DNA primase [Arthrobacter sp. VKM Ac-2550]
MAGLIKREDIDEVRQRTDIKEIVDGYVTLKSAGIGSFKGLCPFHDERSPSFHVRPQVGSYHCFGCGEGGDVISFVQKMDHGTFSETVEKLAHRINFTLRYEDGGTGPRREDVGKRQRMLDAHKIAAEFFREQLLTPGGATGRQFLSGRGFDQAAADHFGVGYAPQGWDSLLKHLTGRGFTQDELKLTGMFSEGNRGIYDRFRGRLIWPIRDIAGDTVGFGARKLFEDDQGPKYLNTPETTLYKKSQVLYGIDLAKRDIARNRQLVVVEGYTDVMACHLAGIGTAVATCGTAFGTDHIKIARRLLSDDGTGGEVIFTFDGDAAGQKAALRAFDEDQRFIAQTFVAVEPNGADPCDLRLSRGEAAVRDLIGSRRPLFEFAIKATLKKFDLNTVEGRVQALRASAPVVAQIRDSAMRPAYSRELAGWLGMEVDEVLRAVSGAAKRLREQQQEGAVAGNGQARPGAAHQTQQGGSSQQRNAGQERYPGQQGRSGQFSQRPPEGRQYPTGPYESSRRGSGPDNSVPAPAFTRPDPRDPVARMEREALEVALQQPGLLDAGQWQSFTEVRFRTPAHALVHDAVRAAGFAGATPSQWVESVRQEVPEELRSLVSELAVTPLPAHNDDALKSYCKGILNRLFDLQITQLKAEKMGQLQRMDPSADPELFQQLNRELMELEMQRRALRSE